ncbi:MAG TPA: 2Fe-2S iron-sulfur cluster-binding protein [Roseibacillus sp.]|nr:2Fe-2S iron-sulfur cluster-binding protein [Roseibacillus sp.]MDP7495455.1 2Fe-2S iron-sulfur cluster-binding protein [Roseibacillus sp.]HJM63885.1 2Fe-2S iron-sulfur cluster-binding protein [Roseibacillus sp.]
MPIKLKIDSQEIELEEPTTIIRAAAQLGIEIPAMCYKEGYDYFTSCMMCVVRDRVSGRTMPACSAQVAEGMEIETQCDEIRAARKATLELLLSDHVGDCEAPCQRLCAIHSEIPKMIREIKDEKFEEAIATVREDMAIPSILERFCNAPCEKGCRRSAFDEGVSIRHLTRFIADWDLKRERPFLPSVKEDSGKKIAIVGSGATGLSLSFYLTRAGHACTVYEREGQPGGRLRSADFDQSLLPDWVIDGELRVLELMGVEFRNNCALGDQVSLEKLRAGHDGVVLACGETGKELLEAMGVPVTEKGLKINPKTAMTGTEGVFAAGNVVKKGMPILKSVQTAKQTAECVSQFVNGQPIEGIVEIYNHMMGRLQEGEIDIFVSGADPIPRVKPEKLEAEGYDLAQAKLEGGRCMHCDCRASHNCLLRIYSDDYGAKQNQFKGEERAKHSHLNQNAGAVYESGKCIKCGLCVQVTQKEGESYGFTFVGRGFDVTAGVALDKTLPEGLEKVADQVVEACPTGALSSNEKYQPPQGRPVGAGPEPASTDGAEAAAGHGESGGNLEDKGAGEGK